MGNAEFLPFENLEDQTQKNVWMVHLCMSPLRADATVTSSVAYYSSDGDLRGLCLLQSASKPFLLASLFPIPRACGDENTHFNHVCQRAALFPVSATGSASLERLGSGQWAGGQESGLSGH